MKAAACPLTGLQVWLAVVFDALADARAELDDDAYVAFVGIVCDRVGLEAARLLFGELTREADDDTEADARAPRQHPGEAAA